MKRKKEFGEERKQVEMQVREAPTPPTAESELLPGTWNREKRKLILLGCLLLAGCLFFPVRSFYRRKQKRVCAAVVNETEVIGRLRSALAENASAITIRFVSSRDLRAELPALAERWMEAAFADSGKAAEGDYLRFQCGGWESRTSCKNAAKNYHCSIRIVPRYYGFRIYEEKVTQEVRRLIQSFSFTEAASDYEKIRCVYDYLCQHVRYDQVHRKNTHYVLRSTAYAALVQGQATCQGYAVALYRLLRELGIPCRVITGSAKGEGRHAWNIVKLEGAYYNLDATWDAGAETYRYFLKGREDFSDHEPEAVYRSEPFTSACPLAETSFALPDAKRLAERERKIA